MNSLNVYEYRKLVVPVAGVLYAVLASIIESGADVAGSIWQVSAWSALVAGITAAAIWFPKSVVAKTVASLAGAIGVTVVAVITDGVVTTGEAVQVAAGILAFITTAAIPNASTTQSERQLAAA